MMNIDQPTRGLESLKEDYENEARMSASTKLKGDVDTAAKFDVLVDMVQTSFSEVQLSMQDLLKLKDELLLHFLPPPLLFKLAVVFGKVFRSFSDMNTPVTELLRLVKIYSTPWEKNSLVLKKIHDMYENKKQMLNIAIKRLALVDKKTKLFAREKRVLNWEKLYIKLSESKGHGRRWKFQMDTFRKKADQGYDELIKWVVREPNEQTEEFETKNETKPQRAKSKVEKEKSFVNDNFEQSNLSMDMDKSNFSEDNAKNKNNDENFINEVDSDQDLFSDASSEGGRRGRRKQKKEVAEVNTQTVPDVEEKSIWTGEPNYTRYLVVRMFKPAELNSKKLKINLTWKNITQHSKTFDLVKKVVIVDSKFQRKNSKSKIAKSDKQSEKQPEAEQKEPEKKIDLNKYEDFVFEMDDYTMKREVLSTSTENSIVAELNGVDDKELLGYSLIQLDDIHTLDLPILYHKENNQVEVIEHDTENKPQNKLESSKLLNLDEFIEDSLMKYDMISKRPPMTFEMYKTKAVKSNDLVCKLPLMFFWIRKPSLVTRDKNTATQSLRDIVIDLTGFDINEKSRNEIEEFLKGKEIRDSACSPMTTPSPTPKPMTPKRPMSSPSEKADSEKMDEKLEEIHEEYQMKIDELKLVIFRLENEVTQLKSLNEFKSDDSALRPRNSVPRRVDFVKSSNLRKSEDQTRSRSVNNEAQKNQTPVPSNHTFVQKQSMWTKNIPEGFYERLKIFNEKSYLHQKEIIEKYVSEEAAIIEQQMAVQHRLDTNKDPYNAHSLDDFCLPAVFMPFKSANNVYNPRARQYFHPSGTDIRITQPPSVFQLPPLPSKPTLSVINLFDLGKRYEAGEPDYYINEYINATASKLLNNQEINQSNTEANN